MTATATLEAHRRIEQLSLVMLDVLPVLQASPVHMEHAQQFAKAEVEHRPLFDRFAISLAAHTGKATHHSYERGPNLALLHCAVIEVAFGRTRTPLRWCPHRTASSLPTDLTIISLEIRHAGCPTCAKAELQLHKDTLAHDNTCDVCGADHGRVTPRMLQLGAALVSLHTGPCCDELLTHAEPVEVRTYARARRNDRCPCGSGRKFKVCCLMGGAR